MFPGEHGQGSLGIYLGGICWNTGHECSPNKVIQIEIRSLLLTVALRAVLGGDITADTPPLTKTHSCPSGPSPSLLYLKGDK